tara:strand:+ start:13 stop:1221 length:1209 start_codon:yes stop_codon:yes gene_type:complete
MSIVLNGSTGITTPDIDSTAGFDASDLTGALPAIDGSALTGISPFKPVAVTGTTPSLDVGSYNFFRQTLTGDTTISFASVPTDARWQYSYIATIDPSTLNDLDTAVYSGKSGSTGTQTGMNGCGLFFKPDGLSMYVAATDNYVWQYTLSTAWDVTTSVYSGKFIYTYPTVVQAHALFFKPDGLSMYMMGRSNDKIFQFTLSTAWDVSTASYASKSLSTLAQDNNPYGLAFSSDGTKAYMVGGTGATAYQYTLSTAWDVSTGSYASKSFVLQAAGVSEISFSSDGLTMLSIGDVAPETVHQYTLSTAWDISTASYASKSLDVSNEAYIPRSIAIINGGRSFAVLDAAVTAVRTFDMAVPYSLTIPASVVGLVSPIIALEASITLELITDDAGVTVTLISEEII